MAGVKDRASRSDAAPRPHILVLMCDQMQASRMGFVDGIAHTPTLDRLAAEGVHFTRAYTCHGQCVPARASFQTGLYPHECGVMVIYGFHEHQARLTSKYQTIGQLFKKAGYDTAYFGKTHFGVPLSDLGYDTADRLSWLLVSPLLSRLQRD